MESQRSVRCHENEDLAAFMQQMRQQMVDSKEISEKIDLTLSKAYASVCGSKTPIKTLKDFSQVKGVGKWILRLMQGFFPKDPDPTATEEPKKKGKGSKGPRRYIPQKNSVAYALLIALYREISNGATFMKKQELIDAAEASGLARAPIVPEKGKGKPGLFMSSSREWYSGWSCMKGLITKGLVVKSSCPAKYMLTEEGQETARECLLRSGLVDSTDCSTTQENIPSCPAPANAATSSLSRPNSINKEAAPTIDLEHQKKPADVPTELLDRFTELGYAKEQIHLAFMKVSEASQNKKSSSLWFDILQHLQKDQVDSLFSNTRKIPGNGSPVTTETCSTVDIGQSYLDTEGTNKTKFTAGGPQHYQDFSCSADSVLMSCSLQACTSSDLPVPKSLDANIPDGNMNCLAMPPRRFGEKFEDLYDVILILDDREQFTRTNRGSRSRKIIDNICTQFKIQVEVRRLPVGDGIWIARHKDLGCEYVLDFIVERKEVNDLSSSIRDNRYRDQKLRLERCGLQKLIYVVEGDPNTCEAAESIKTACFTTEILEGFDVQRTNGLTDTLRRYGSLTRAITQYYGAEFSNDSYKSSGTCLTFEKFIRKCQDLDKMTVSDVFAVQLMQVPRVTEEIVFAVLEMYPTLLSLACAYSRLEGNIRAQEEMLKTQNSLISSAASKNIFKLVWGVD